MRLEVRDPVFAAIASTVAARADGVARLHTSAWLSGARLRPRSRGVDVTRHGDRVVVGVRVAVHHVRPVVETLRTVQRSVHDEIARLTGVDVEVVVTVVDVD